MHSLYIIIINTENNGIHYQDKQSCIYMSTHVPEHRQLV